MQRESVSVRDITNFLIDEGEVLYARKDYVPLFVAIAKHKKYKTIEVLTDNKGIKAVCRYNHITPRLILVIDTVLRKDARNKRTLAELIESGINRNPDIKYITYDRGKKYPNRQRKLYKITDLIRR